jgi:calcium/calmodulin-dependent protein kinase I
VKIADFGISKRLEENTNATTSFGGTFDFMAPELRLSSGSNATWTSIDPYAADIWAVGCTAYFLLMKTVPFSKKSMLDYIRELIPCPSASLPTSEAGRLFVSALFDVEPRNRPSASDAQEHPWLKKPAPEAETEALASMRSASGSVFTRIVY